MCGILKKLTWLYLINVLFTFFLFVYAMTKPFVDYQFEIYLMMTWFVVSYFIAKLAKIELIVGIIEMYVDGYIEIERKDD